MAAPRYARRFDEAHLFMDLRPCECGEASFDRERALATVDGERVVRYLGDCAGCGRAREFAFRLSPHRDDPRGTRYGTPGEPSRLLDAAEWLAVSDLLDLTARELLDDDAEPLGLDGLTVVAEMLGAAADAAEEAATFLPRGAAAVPARALWSGPGREMRDATPERFGRRALADLIRVRRAAADEFVRELAAAAPAGDGGRGKE